MYRPWGGGLIFDELEHIDQSAYLSGKPIIVSVSKDVYPTSPWRSKELLFQLFISSLKKTTKRQLFECFE